MYGAFILVNLLDLISTAFALRIGLFETNSLLISTASALGVGLVDAFIWLKVLFFVGTGFLVLVGIYTKYAGTRKAITITMLLFTLLFALVSANNFGAIISNV